MKKARSSEAFDDDRWEVPSGHAPSPRTTSGSRRRSSVLSPKGWGSAGRRNSGSSPTRHFEERRVYVEVKYVKVQGKDARDNVAGHIVYIERDGVAADGTSGVLYGPEGELNSSAITTELPGEKHQLRLIISPDDGHELELEEFVRRQMDNLQRRLGQPLLWAAANHYNTDNPHTHLVLRGVDANGREVRLPKEMVKTQLRDWAGQIATDMIGPRTERSRIAQFAREVKAERSTSLDRELTRRMNSAGIVQPLEVKRQRWQDPFQEAALRERLLVLAAYRLAERQPNGKWRISAQLNEELREMAWRAEAYARMQQCAKALPAMRGVVRDQEPEPQLSQEFERGVQGIVRWKGMNERSQLCAVIETTSGRAVFLPLSARAIAGLRVGMGFELKKSVDKDAHIHEAATKNAGVFDLMALKEEARKAYERRVNQLAKLKLAQPLKQAGQWSIVAELPKKLAQLKPQAYWQKLSVRGDQQPLSRQTRYCGYVWLDRVKLKTLGNCATSTELRERIVARHSYLKSIGQEPSAADLRWSLRERQRVALAQRLTGALKGGPELVTERKIGRGKLTIHRMDNGQSFAVIVRGRKLAVLAATRALEGLDGKQVSVQPGSKRKVVVREVESAQEKKRGREL